MIDSAKSRQFLVDDLLADAMELPKERRRDFIVEKALNEDILAETLSLIEYGGALDEEDSARKIWGGSTGERVGPYLLHWLLGKGTCGEVYLAIREDLGQRVAFKMVRPSGDLAEQARFETEARLLASFEHPNIIRLIDYGRSPSGQLYLVMELAGGGTLQEWLEQNHTNREGLLRLFVKICDAVQFAHSNLIIHRDIKPSNVLMDSRGEPKLADFGIVQMIGTLASVTSAVNRPQILAGTPAYASPELFRGSPLTTASDVFSLGVMLRQFLNQEPNWAKHPGSPDRGTKNLGESSRDLDAILARCLDENPRSRYANAGELRDELQAHLDHRPVKAGDHSWVHVATLFILRNRIAVAATAIMFVLLAGALFWIWQQNVALEKTATALRAAVSEKSDRINRVMEAAEHFDQVQRAEYKDNSNGAPNPTQALTEAERQMQSRPSLDTRFHAAVCGVDLAEILLRADGKNERVEGWKQLNRSRELLLSIEKADPEYFGIKNELEAIDGIRKELNAGQWTGTMGFASDRVPPKLRPEPDSVRPLEDARAARALGDLWRSLGERSKASMAYDRAIQLFDRAASKGIKPAVTERNECVGLRTALR